MSKIALLVTSTRVNAVGPAIGDWLKPILESAAPEATFTTVRVADFKLPVFDEVAIPAMVPAMAQWTKPHSKAWSAEIAKYDGYVILANEYNFGMSAATKNAIDYIYNEWIGKPILIVSYGIAGGSSASEQLMKVLTGMKTKPIETRPQMSFLGGVGAPDLTAAMTQGTLGNETRESWEKEKKPEIVKGVQELMAVLKEAKETKA